MDFEDEGQMLGFESLLKGSSTPDVSMMRRKTKKDKKRSKLRGDLKKFPSEKGVHHHMVASGNGTLMGRHASKNKVPALRALEFREEEDDYKAVKFEAGQAKNPSARVRKSPKVPSLPLVPNENQKQALSSSGSLSSGSTSARERGHSRTMSWSEAKGGLLHTSSEKLKRQNPGKKEKGEKKEKRSSGEAGESNEASGEEDCRVGERIGRGTAIGRGRKPVLHFLLGASRGRGRWWRGREGGGAGGHTRNDTGVELG